MKTTKCLTGFSLFLVAIAFLAPAPLSAQTAYFPMPESWVNVSLEYLLLDQTITNFNDVPPEVPPSFAPTILSQVPAGYAIKDGVYAGWCVEPGVDLSELHYTARLYDGYDPSLPSPLTTLPWNQLNYILNNKPLGWTNAMVVQQAIWALIQGTPPFLVNLYSPKAAQLLQAALTYGTTFVPTTNHTHAVLIYPDRTVQKLIVELLSITTTNTNTYSFTTTLVLTNNQLILGWQGAAATYTLESTTNLADPLWIEVPNSTGKSSVTVPMLEPRRFYRWRRQ